jgi:nitroreductase
VHLPSRSDEVYDAIRSLRVVRAFRPDPIPREVLDEILEAGRWTGSSKNRQGWAFVVVDDAEGRDRLASAGSFSGPIRASAVSVALVRTAEGNDFDIGRVAQNIMLAAAARGVGSCPVTLHDSDRARQVTGIPPDAECRYAVALGYADEGPEQAQRTRRREQGVSGRKPVGDIVHWGIWET